MSQPEKTSDFKTGATRSADANHLDFTSLPLVGLIGVARTASEGGTKYGRYNYVQGMPIHDTLNHSIRHVFMFLLGDRSEPHLEHAAWGVLASIQQNALDQSVSAPYLLGPGATITPEVQAHLDANKDDLAARRKAGEFAGIGEWNLRDLPEIKTLLAQRKSMADGNTESDELNQEIRESLNDSEEWAKVLKKTAKKSRKPFRDRRVAKGPWSEIVNHAAAKYVDDLAERAKRSAGLLKNLGKIRDTSAIASVNTGVSFGPNRYDALFRADIDRINEAAAIIPGEPVYDRGERFRVEHPFNGEKRICRGKIHCNNRSVKPGSREFARALIVDRQEQMYALMSPELCNEQVLVVQEEDWDAGQPYSIDSDWGYASASSRCSKITGEVTRTEYATEADLGDPLPDEHYHYFIGAGVRVYFKKS